jgi:hypothetical protein
VRKISARKDQWQRIAHAMSIAALVLCANPMWPQTLEVVHTNIDTYQKEVQNTGKLPTDEQGTIGSYIGISEVWSKIGNCAAQDICPDIVLLDTPLNADRSLTVQQIGQAPHDLPSEAGANPILGFKDEDHGTAMAGIIAAQNGTSGLVGVNPEARLFAVDWSYYGAKESTRAALVDVLGDVFTHRKTTPPILVLASGWTSDIPLSKLPCGSGQRFPNHGALENFFSIHPGVMIIVSAGQDQKSGGKDITRNSTLAPQNLGDCSNVIVVTACSACSDSSPKIPDWANYSTEGLVQIAAYGDDVLTIKGSGYLTEMKGGTSPAAAFVAGVASAMVAKWPNSYNFRPASVKFRLQLTATPSLVGPEGSKLSSGILYPELAIKNPTADYLATPNTSFVEVHNAGWCVDQIQVSRNGGSAEAIIDVATIYRISCPATDQCTVFHADLEEQQAGIIERSGPGTIKGNILLNASTSRDPGKLANPAIFEADGATYRPAEFTEIVLNASRQPVGGRSCQ